MVSLLTFEMILHDFIVGILIQFVKSVKFAGTCNIQNIKYSDSLLFMHLGWEEEGVGPSQVTSNSLLTFNFVTCNDLEYVHISLVKRWLIKGNHLPLPQDFLRLP